jgi:hypothetical protein
MPTKTIIKSIKNATFIKNSTCRSGFSSPPHADEANWRRGNKSIEEAEVEIARFS